MVENYGALPKVLAIVSTLAVVVMSIAALVANLLGGMLITAFLVVCLAVFLKVVAFAFEPTELMTYSGEPEREPEEWIEKYAQHFGGEAKPAGEAPDRILPGNDRDSVAVARIIGGSPAQKNDPADEVVDEGEAERRKEDREWANMFRAL